MQICTILKRLVLYTETEYNLWVKIKAQNIGLNLY